MYREPSQGLRFATVIEAALAWLILAAIVATFLLPPLVKGLRASCSDPEVSRVVAGATPVAPRCAGP